MPEHESERSALGGARKPSMSLRRYKRLQKALYVLVQNLHLHVRGPGQPYAGSSKAQHQVAALHEVEVLKHRSVICGWQSRGRFLSRCSRVGRQNAQDLTQRGAEVLAVPCDVTNQEQVRSLVDQATQRFGRVDIVVNHAGILQVGPMFTTTVDDFATALDVMFWGALYPTLAVLPQMRARRSGHVVNITSIGGMVSVPHLLPYICAKFAAVGLSEGLRPNLAR